jgi:hypothetical protein
MEATTEGIRMSGRSSGRIATATQVLAAVLGVGYIAAGLVGAALDSTGGDGSDLAFWLAFLVGGGALVLIGTFLLGSRPALSAALTSVGALAGAVAVFWSVIVPVLALVLVVLCIARARRASDASRSVSPA